MNLALAALLLCAQDPDSPNLKPPADAPKDAVEAVDKAARLLEEARKAKTDPLETVERAIEELKKADKLAAKTFPAIHYHLGIAYQWTKEYNEARRRLERALDLNPNFHEAMVELGDVKAWLKDYPGAIKVYDRALAMRPDYPLAYKNRAIALIRNDDFKGARESIEKAVSLDPKDESGKHLVEMLKKEIDGPKWAGTRFTRTSDHFTVDCDADQAFTDAVSKHLELIYAKYNSIFPQLQKPRVKFRCIVFRDLKGYLENGSPPNTGGYYQDLMKKLVLFKNAKESDTLLVLYHEAFHQFLAYYLSDAPQWFNEGHGDYFGPSTWDEKSKRMEIHLNSWRLPVIQAAIQFEQTQPMEKLLLMTKAELYDPRTISINYAQAWSFVHFLWHYEDGKYGKCLQLYFKALTRGAGLREAYQEGFGKVSMEVLEREWKMYVQRLR